MDTITQALLGAAVAQAGFGKRLGPRAMLIGALYGSLPDADILSGAFGSWASMVHHRGITHSLFFAPVVAPALGWLAWRMMKRRDAWTTWAHLAFWAVITHPLLDLFTSYGTQLLSPFSDRRFALDAIPIVDPIYSIPLLAAVLVAVLFKRRPIVGVTAAWATLAATTGYLLFGWHQSATAQRIARAQLEGEGFAVSHMRVQPSMLVWMWRIAARNEQGDLRVGMLSTWKITPIEFHEVNRPGGPLVEAALESPRGRLFRWFADEMVGVRVVPHDTGTTVFLDDQRYGRATQPEASFWGARAEFDGSGKLIAVERERRTAPREMRNEIAATWNMMWSGAPTGDPSPVASGD